MSGVPKNVIMEPCASLTPNMQFLALPFCYFGLTLCVRRRITYRVSKGQIVTNQVILPAPVYSPQEKLHP